jgi:hypothetical protein
MAGTFRPKVLERRAFTPATAPVTERAASDALTLPMTERTAAIALSSQRLIAGSNALSLPRERGDGVN